MAYESTWNGKEAPGGEGGSDREWGAGRRLPPRRTARNRDCGPGRWLTPQAMRTGRGILCGAKAAGVVGGMAYIHGAPGRIDSLQEAGKAGGYGRESPERASCRGGRAIWHRLDIVAIWAPCTQTMWIRAFPGPSAAADEGPGAPGGAVHKPMIGRRVSVVFRHAEIPQELKPTFLFSPLRPD